MVNIFAIGSFVAAFSAGLVIILTVLQRSSEKNSLIFILMNFAVFVWSLFLGLWQLSANYQQAEILLKILMVGATFIPTLCVHYTISFIGEDRRHRIFFIFAYILSIFLVGTIIFGKGAISYLYKVTYFPGLSFNYWPYAGNIFYIWLAWFFFGFVYSQLLLFLKFKNSRGFYREQLRTFLIVTIISVLGGSTVFPLWYKIQIPPYGIFIIFLYPIVMFYAMARYRYMDIRVVVGRGLIYLASLITIVGFAFLLYGGNYLAGRYVPEQFIWPIIVAVGLMIYPAVFSFYENVAAKLFYYSFYSYQKLLADLGRKLGKVLDLRKLSKMFLDTVIDVMKLEKAALALKKEEGFVLEGNQGFDQAKLKNIFASGILLDYVQGTLKPFSQEEIDSLAHVLRHEPQEQLKIRQIGQDMKDLGVSLIIPMYMEDRLTGLLFLGERLSGAHFSEQDVDTLSDLALQASVAFENARNYSTTKKFTEKLEEEVKERTKQLRATNDKLKELDKEKSDFVALASYHLRTPLTVIKSYVSSVLDGKSEPIPEEMKKPLKIVYDANERLIQFTNELLDVERIESGKIEIKTEPVSLQEMIKIIVNQLGQRATEKNLEFKFNEPANALPPVQADKSKLEQVIYNVIDNALKYTMKGSVIVDLKKQGAKQLIEVSDTGEGMTAEEQANIFGKFTRGESGKKMYVKGSGIGLYIAKKFLEMHKGKIWAQSRGEGLGSTFYIEVPE